MAEVEQVTVPDIGDFTDVPVIEVFVHPGDSVAEEDPLVTLESDKATMDVPSPFGGIVKEVLLKVGDTASQGTVVATIAVKAESGAPTEAAAPSAVRTAIAAEMSARPASAPPPEPTPPEPQTTEDAPAYASPSVRRRARELGIDLSTIQGSGRKGRITVEDLEGGAAAAEPAVAASNGAPAAPAKPAVLRGEEYREPLTRIQKLSRDSLSKAWQTIPHVTHHEDADITDLEAFRKQLNSEQSDVKVTMVALLLKAMSSTLDQFPRFASSLDGDDLIIKPQRHLGFAADTPQGLVVPVIRDVDQKGLFQIAADLTELSGKARSGKLGPKDISGAVFTLSSLGGIGGTNFTPIVNPPQVAILGAVRSAMKPVWNGSEFVPRLILPLSLSYDHRVIDGAAAARFMAHLSKVLGDFRRVLL